MAQAYADL